MEFEIVSKESIKPSSPTPPELRHLSPSLFDAPIPCHYVECVFFYHNNESSAGGRRRSHSEELKESLSEVLTHYYPFAGRLIDGASVECNDAGATFTEANLRCPMSDVTKNDEIWKLLCPGDGTEINPILSVQLTRFQCGGEAICVFLSHKISDLVTFATFMNDWASIARNHRGHHELLPVSPQFNASSFFPPGRESCPLVREQRRDHIVVKRFAFESPKIAALKAMVSEKVENPTRTQLLSALIYKAAVISTGGLGKQPLPPSSLLQMVNIRKRVVPPLPEALKGNIITFFVVPLQEEVELWEVVRDMKRNFEEFCDKYPKNYEAVEWCSLHKLYMEESFGRMAQNFYLCSSWCNVGLYEVDFGWGKPAWITMPDIIRRNSIGLMDAKDGEGMEAVVCLDKEVMAVFEKNQELLSFGCLKS
ncbi:vinorine synthase-like [Momordica charantia]|uniref:Vinorine synthase-like n=1 Tax=Momordica charantia TaxID=3673 RepID=A0A6J1CQD5_MOMCH|nr:vinorine synthase-like [Momordica charantia]